jgi:hypothetical protein
MTLPSTQNDFHRRLHVDVDDEFGAMSRRGGMIFT